MHYYSKKKAMEKNKDQENYRNEIYSKSVRAGKRTYFFDVKSTRSGDHYLTITESKKKFDQDGNFHFEKHKIFLYKEDFNKFQDAMNVTLDHVKDELLPDVDFSQFDREYESDSNSED